MDPPILDAFGWRSASDAAAQQSSIGLQQLCRQRRGVDVSDTASRCRR
jgi:hypothetical protein